MTLWETSPDLGDFPFEREAVRDCARTRRRGHPNYSSTPTFITENRTVNMATALRTLSTASRVGLRFKSTKVAVLGASGGIGQPLALLCKLSENIDEVACYDVAPVLPGVAAGAHRLQRARRPCLPSLALTRTLALSRSLALPHGRQDHRAPSVCRRLARHARHGPGGGAPRRGRGRDPRGRAAQAGHDAR